MGWSGGVFSRTNGDHTGTTVWAQDAAEAIGITDVRHDSHDQDLAVGINACIAKDGTNAMSANLNLGGYTLANWTGNCKLTGGFTVNGTTVLGTSADVSPDSLGAGHVQIKGSGYVGYVTLDGTAMYVGHNSASRTLSLQTDETTRFTISAVGNVSIGTAAVATTATDGFLYVTSCAGVPTGAPTAITGRLPIVIDSTNHRLYFYSGGAWRNAGP